MEMANKKNISVSLAITAIIQLSLYVPDTADSWGTLFNAAYKGRIALIDDPWELMVAPYKYLGYSINTSDESEPEQGSTFFFMISTSNAYPHFARKKEG